MLPLDAEFIVKSTIYAWKTKTSVGVLAALLVSLNCVAEVSLGPWNCIGPFKDEEFGNVGRSLEFRFGPEVDYLGEAPDESLEGPPNLAIGATASSPDEMEIQKPSDTPAAAVDGNESTFWDDTDGGKLYVLRLDFKAAATFNALKIIGWQHKDFSPKAFTVVCDDKEVAAVNKAAYANNEFLLGLPETTASSLELRITRVYGGSPAIRELELYLLDELPVVDAPPIEPPDFSKVYQMKPFPGYLDLERKWEVREDWSEGYHNLLPRGPAPSRNESVYLYRTLTSDKDENATIHLRVKDFYKVWLNGRLVAIRNRLQGASTIYPKPNAIRLNLRKGENQLLVKNTVRWAERGFSFGVEGMHEVQDRHYIDINTHQNDSEENARKYVDGFKFGPTPIPMYSPVKYDLDTYLRRFSASSGAVAYDDKLAALNREKTPTPAFAKRLEAALDAEIRALGPIIFVRHPLVAVNAIGPYTNAGAAPSAICLLDPSKPSAEPNAAKPRVIFHQPDMRIYDMCLSFDAKTIYFSAKAKKGATWQICSVGVDGSNFTQVTNDPKSENISPCELPNGRLAFISTRHGAFVVCQSKRAGILFTMAKDGSDLRLISGNIDSDHTPRVTNDGRIMFTRWDYGIEKNVFARHGLWTVNPDGTRLSLLYGNTIEDPGGLWSPAPVPGRPEVVCVFGPHHNYHAGMIGLVWNGRGTENTRGEGYRWITREFPVYGDRAYPDGYQDPYAINEKQFLCSYGGVSARKKAGADKRDLGNLAPLKLMYLDVYGNERIIYKDPDGLSCYQPILLRTRESPPVIPDSIPPNRWRYRDTETMNRRNADVDKTATMLVQDVYRGISSHVKRGEAKYIAVMEQVQKSRMLTGGEAWGHSPLIGRGTVHARRLVGLVPILEDGSAQFTVPAMRSLSLNVLDADGRTLMRMGSDMTVMPGEQAGCVGCHEVREGVGVGGSAPPPSFVPLAMKKKPVTPKVPEAGWATAGLIDYIQVIQPIWDKHCVSCHDGPKPNGGVNMTADKTRFFCQSYGQLVDRDIVDHLSVFSLGHDENTPRTVGAMVSRIDEFMDEAHCESKLTWDERFRVYCWIDANVPYYGMYDSELVEGKPRGLGMRDSWETKNANVTWATGDLQEVFDKRCLDCHRRPALNQSWLIPVHMEVASDIWGDKALTSHGFGKKWRLVNKLGPEFRINLTNPSHSSLLQAPLAKDAGGLGMCQTKKGKPVFRNRQDADYQTMLSAIEVGAGRLEQHPRVDMLGLDRLMNPATACADLAVHPELAQSAVGVTEHSAAPAGFVVCIGKDTVERSLLTNEGAVVQCLATTDLEVDDIRTTIKVVGVYGRVSAIRFDGERLPYADSTVNRLVIGASQKVAQSEIDRVLAPGGVLVRDGKETVRSRPDAMDEWTHFMYDASGVGAGNDRAVGPPRHIQWQAGPAYSRSHENMSSVSASVSAGGRVFSIMDDGPKASIYLPSEWSLTARDAFSGVLLWSVPIDEWHARLFPLKNGPTQLPHRLVASGDRVYVTLGLTAPVSELDAATGEVLRVFEGTEHTEEIRLVDGKLIVVTHDDGGVNPFRGLPPKARPDFPRDEKALDVKGPRSLSLIDLKSGKPLWQRPQGDLVPLTTVVADERVFLICGNLVRCISLDTGDVVWEQSVAKAASKVSLAISPTTLVYEDSVFVATDGTLLAFDAPTGDKLWSQPCAKTGFRMPASIFAVNGLIWDVDVQAEPYKPKNKNELPNMETTDIPPGPGVEARRHFIGYEPRTGKVGKDIPMYGDQSFGVMHHRCHIPRASGDYLLTGYPGIEFVDTNDGSVQSHSWIRGACLYGFMPANGLIYTPPHPCACYIQAKMSGYNAVAPARETTEFTGNRLEKGPAFGKVERTRSKPEDWPTFRGDPARSGSSKTHIVWNFDTVWKTPLQGKLTQPVIAEGKVFVASIDAHTIHALDEGSGMELWSCTAGGRVDSSPTVHKGHVIFGSRDGYVYSLRASDGELVWRFLAARDDRRIISYEQPESVWPVHGSVLVEGDRLFVVAGRNAFLDGGLVIYALDPKTGMKRSQRDICMLGEDGRQPPSLRLQMDAAMPDILASDGERVYMRQYAMNYQTRPVEQDRDHLFCPTGFLDDEWFRRSYWVYGNRAYGGAQGWATSGNVLPSGRIMSICDNGFIYGFGRDFYPPSPGNAAQMYAMGEREMLFASEKLNFTEEYNLADVKSPYGVKAQPAIRSKAKQKGHVRWATDPEMRVMAMVVADYEIYVAGTRGDWTTSPDAFKGNEGVALKKVSVLTGETTAEVDLPAAPVFDGMSAANGRLFISTVDGAVICIGK